MPTLKGSQRPAWTLAVVVVLVQLALVLWLGEGGPTRFPAAPREPRVALLPEGAVELALMMNPTVFAWGDSGGAGGSQDVISTPTARPPPRYTEPPRWMNLKAEDLTGIATLLAVPPDSPRTSVSPALPAPTVVADVLGATSLRQQSIFELTRGLAERRLPDGLVLPSLPHADVLGDTVLQVTIDAVGRVRSVLPLVECGLPAADALALDTTRKLRFAPLPGTPRLPAGPVPPFTIGEAVFRWHTVPPPPG